LTILHIVSCIGELGLEELITWNFQGAQEIKECVLRIYHHHKVIHTWLPACCSLQFETEAEGGRLRRDVTAEGSVAPVGATRSERTSNQSIFSGREEVFAFRRAVTYISLIPCFLFQV
jgi:hypothetical protein